METTSHNPPEKPCDNMWYPPDKPFIHLWERLFSKIIYHNESKYILAQYVQYRIVQYALYFAYCANTTPLARVGPDPEVVETKSPIFLQQVNEKFN